MLQFACIVDCFWLRWLRALARLTSCVVLGRAVSHAGHESLIGTPVLPGSWCHLAFCFDHVTQRQYILHNGREVASTPTDQPRRALRSTVHLMIGRAQELARGFMRELSVWKVALTPDMCQAHMTHAPSVEVASHSSSAQLLAVATSSTDGLLAAWPLRSDALDVVASAAEKKSTAGPISAQWTGGAGQWWVTPPVFRAVSSKNGNAPFAPGQFVYTRHSSSQAGAAEAKWERALLVSVASEHWSLRLESAVHDEAHAVVTKQPSEVVTDVLPTAQRASFALPPVCARPEQESIDSVFASYWASAPASSSSAGSGFSLLTLTPSSPGGGKSPAAGAAPNRAFRLHNSLSSAHEFAVIGNTKTLGMVESSYTVECWVLLERSAGAEDDMAASGGGGAGLSTRSILAFENPAEAVPNRGFEMGVKNGKSFLGYVCTLRDALVRPYLLVCVCGSRLQTLRERFGGRPSVCRPLVSLGVLLRFGSTGNEHLPQCSAGGTCRQPTAAHSQLCFASGYGPDTQLVSERQNH